MIIKNDFKIKDNEEEDAYIYRICSNKEIIGTWEEVSDILNNQLNYTKDSSAYRKKYQSFMKIFESIKDTFDTNCSELEIDEKIMEFQKERVKVRTEKLGYNQAIREVARLEMEYEYIKEAIENTERPIAPPIIIPKKTTKAGILAFGDSHYGKILKILDLKGNILNEYSPEIFEERMWKVRDEVVEICKKEGLDKITIFDMGDAIEGILRISSLQSLKFGSVEASMRYAKFVATWLNDLSKNVYIDYYSVEGNHDDTRVLTGKKGDFPHENFGRVINNMIRLDLQNNKNVNIVDMPNPKMIYTELAGFNILGTHGEERNKDTAIREYEDVYDVKINFLFGGHLHHRQSKEVGLNKEYIGCGSIIGIDDYSVSLKRTANPTAKFVVLQEGKGKIDYTINL